MDTHTVTCVSEMSEFVVGVFVVIYWGLKIVLFECLLHSRLDAVICHPRGGAHEMRIWGVIKCKRFRTVFEGNIPRGKPKCKLLWHEQAFIANPHGSQTVFQGNLQANYESTWVVRRAQAAFKCKCRPHFIGRIMSPKTPSQTDINRSINCAFTALQPRCGER